MKLYNDNPNFSIIAPGGCNASCDFCFWKQEPIHKEYVNSLLTTLTNLPKHFHQVSITGGEPCLSPHIHDILNVLRDKKMYGIDKVVLTTNGTGLLDIIDDLEDVVDFVNISRHHWNEDDNAEIFNTDSVPSNINLLELTTRLNKIGIPVNMNTVVTFDTKKQVEKMIHFAKEGGFSSIAFRHQHGSLEAPKLESYFDDFKASYENSCPVCRSKTQIINGFQVNWKSSVVEPKDSFDEDVAYELVFHSNGKTTTDWEGEVEVEVSGGQIFSSIELIDMAKNMLHDYSDHKTFSSGPTIISSGRSCGVSGGC